MIRCLLVDDHPVVREGYRRLLEQSVDIRIIAEAGDAAEGYARYLDAQPEVTITDLTLPGASGLDLVRRIKARCPEARVLVFTMHETPLLVERALKAGAEGFVTKRSPPEVLAQAVRAVCEGRQYVSRDMAEVLRQPDQLTEQARLASLSPRELEILRLLARGHSPGACADILKLSPKTVANYQTLIKEKLDLATLPALVHLALRHRLIEASEA